MKDKTSLYQEIHKKWEYLFDSQSPWYTNLSNAVALLHQELGYFWTGFYLVDGDYLQLGPFQGPTACTRIAKGNGVCGTCWKTKVTQMVPNVHEFPGHIACNSLSQSEIVIPCFNKKGEVWGVLDLDSTSLNDFNKIDKYELEKFCASLEQIDYDRN